MYLKKIIAHGFKSFADNISIDLDNNIAGIVGPNGSGKSNVVDAVRWVLGEQSIKSLRGDGNMTDVIFAGSKSRKAMNIASVTLIFDNKDHYLPLSYDEISIKRRLYKDGTNEYYLNGEKCRLKDVHDILLDSGIAKESFNIISQGKIEEILSSKPIERRVIFEEAAGVIKYKKRKNEALRKLERTHDNMNRINDIISELETQVEPLKKQKEDALKYESLNDELTNLEISLIVSDITKINNEYQFNKLKLENLKEEITKISTNNTTSEAKVEEFKLKINKCDNNIKILQNKLLEFTTLVEQLNSQKQIITERKKYQLEDSKIHDNLIVLKEQELKLNNDLNSLNREIENKNYELEEINNQIEELDNKIKNLKNNRNKIDSELNNKIRNKNFINNKIELLKDNIDNNNLLPQSVKNILDNPKLNGIYDVVGNVIEVEEMYSKAISTALGASASQIIVEDEKTAKEAVNYLKQHKLGRATFLPLATIKSRFIDNTIIDKIKSIGFINIASNLVKYDNKFDNIIKNKLGNILVIDNIDNANKINKLLNYKFCLVTLDGEIFHIGGSITGGFSKVKNIVSLKYELEDKLKEYKINDSNIDELENKINELDYEIKNIEDKLYLTNKQKISISEYLYNKQRTLDDISSNLNSIKQEINGNTNLINNTLGEEEQRVLDDYYKAINNKNKVTDELDKYSNLKNELTHQLEEYEYSLKKENSIYNQKNNELRQLEIDVNRADVKLDNLLNTLNEEYSITYEKAITIYKLEIESELARNKVNNLKREIKKLGPINMAAKEEYDRVAERYEFLISQQDDLSQAENTLLEIIDEMDRVMKEEFLKTFNIIKSNFSETFKELFNGGTADLYLTDKNNLLETGIEIVASPPGKSLKSISLLSGGEKTFTAISLLFAILKTRPMPFCILDEVEAALDEVNVDAFGNYITKIKNKTQFIVITHKKRTMEYADVLYGITMQESGVSKLVSVKLEDIKK